MTHQLTVRPGRFHELALREGEFLRIEQAKGWRLRTISGDLLISAYGDFTDYRIGSRGCFAISTDGLVLVEAIDSSRIQLERLAVRGIVHAFVESVTRIAALRRVEAACAKLRSVLGA
jgi:hypothetical protein